jgi:hypothetical protein
MKTNTDEPINFCSVKDGQTAFYFYGLTKREYFAALAMQGVCSGNITVNSKITGHPAYTAEFAVQCADALIEELNKNNDD